MSDQLERGRKGYSIPVSTATVSFFFGTVGAFVSAVIYAILLRGDVNTVLKNQEVERTARDSLKAQIQVLRDDYRQLRYDLGLMPHVYDIPKRGSASEPQANQP